MELSINDLAQITDYARNYLWSVIIPSVPGGGADPKTLQLLAETASVPGVSSTPIELFYMGMKKKIAGRLEYDGTMDITFKETVGFDVTRAVRQWRALVIDNIKGSGAAPGDYKTPIVYTLLDVGGAALTTFKINGCYPEVVPPIELDYNSSEIIKRSITFAYDNWDQVV